jgi:uncharacterized protein
MAHDPAHEAASDHDASLTAPALVPVTESQRFAELDLLRGVAVLGILAMNIRSFAAPFAVYMNPTLREGFNEGASRWAYLLTAVLFDTKMLSLFSLLFGAGAVMWLSKRTASGKPVLGLWMRRMFWLLVIGCIHAYLIWEGDVLVPYALCGILVLSWARRLPPMWLIALGCVMVAIGGLCWVWIGLGIKHGGEGAEQAIEWFEPSPDALQREVDVYRGAYSEIVAFRAPRVLAGQIRFFLFWMLWRAGGMMLIGAGLMKLGFLTGRFSRRVYGASAIALLSVGGGLAAAGALRLEAIGYHAPQRMFVDQFNYAGSALMAVGYAALFIWLYKGGLLGGAGRALAATGRMAFTNYLAQSVICTFIFYGYGGGLFGRPDYAEQLLVVLGVWALQLAWSPWWLARYHFGPMEWAWRSLTYWRIQPLSRRGEPTAAG